MSGRGTALGEFELIDRLLKPLAAGAPGALGLEDDAALVECGPDRQLVVAKDAVVAGIHFLPDDPAPMVAGKLLRVNLSDLAAMGADPLGYLTVIARPPEIDAAYLEGLAAGFAHDQRAFGLHLLGGDTVSTTGPLVLTLTILGSVPRDAALLRRGARADDLVMVSGTLGEAALGLRVLRGLAVPEDDAVQLVERYRSPQPRLGLGRGLRGVASAAIDISDGLVADLGHILAASGVGAIIEAARIPLSDCAAGLPGALDAALGGGDDYELLVTVPPARRSAAETAAAAAGVRLTTIGRITAAPGLVVQGRDGQAIEPATRGWRHF